jgi:hypothetical protein
MKHTITKSVLESVRTFMEERGSHGFEATAMLAGTTSGAITRAVVPHQVGYRSQHGVAVEVTAEGKRQLAGALTLNERWLARIHSHPGDAFHSDTDDANPALTAQGALSIVVPFFGLGLRRGIGSCAVFAFDDGTWRQVIPDAVLEVVNG